MNEYFKQLIYTWEGCLLTAYKDSVGVWTIGYGHIVGVTEGLTIIQEQADAWLIDEYLEYSNAVLSCFTFQLLDYELGALTSLCYNIGIEAFCKSTLVQVIQSDKENLDLIAENWIQWDNAGGSSVNGLLKRRVDELNTYLGNNIVFL